MPGICATVKQDRPEETGLMADSNEADAWASIERANREYEGYLRIQQVTDVLSVLRQEANRRDIAPRTDLPLSLDERIPIALMG